MSSFWDSVQRLARLAGYALLPAPATSLTASTFMEKSECEKMSAHEASTSTASADEEERKEKNLLSILNDSKISEKILSHLTVRDMKAASQVNSTFCRMVRGSLCFREKVVLVLPKDAVGVEEILENTRLCCDEGVVDLSASLRTVQLLSEKTKEFFIRGDSKTSFWLRMEQLTKLLKDSPELKLKTLFVDIRELEELSTVVLELVEFLDLMTSTECLYVSDNLLGGDYDDIVWGNGDFVTYDPMARMSLEPISEPSRSQKLKSFITSFKYEYSHPVVLEVTEEILKRHKETLGVFRCNYYTTWRQDFMKTMKIPLLEVLSAVVNAADEQMFIGFLEGLENLRDLEIEVDAKLSKSLLAAIKKRSSKLRRLHIRADNFSEVYAKEDWSFLGSMELLKEFRIDIEEFDADSYVMEFIVTVTASLPPNQLSDLNFSGPWDVVGNFEPEKVSYDLWMSSWKKLQCLRKLTFGCCLNLIDDDLMQMILRECKELQELEMEDIPELTMKGFTGIPSESEGKGISVKDHQNLRSLSITDCPKIQPKDVVSTDAFRNLKSLYYAPAGIPRELIPDDIVVLLILKNPRLESLRVPLTSDDSAERIMENVKAWNHPLRKLIRA